MSLRLVPEDPDGPLTREDADGVFQEHWYGAREAYAQILLMAGSLGHPLCVMQGPVGRERVRSAAYSADKIVEHANQLATQLAACAAVFERVEPLPRRPSDG